MAVIEQYYDSVADEMVSFRPLDHQFRSVIAQGLGDQAMDCMVALGSCGNPEAPGFTSHRPKLFRTLGGYGIAPDKIKNPEVSDWNRSRAPVEAIWAARARGLSIVVTNETPSPAGIAEAGLMTYGSILRGQYVCVQIESNEKSPDDTKVARELALSILKATRAQFPLFTLENNLDRLAHTMGRRFVDLESERLGAGEMRKEYRLPPIRGDLIPEIYLSGSSGTSKPVWMKELISKMKALKSDLPIDDSFRIDWKPSMIKDELVSKLNCAVQIQVVTDETDALGALAETGARVMQADLTGQSYGLYIAPERKHSAKQKQNSDSNRTRTLVLEHLRRLKQDFPNTPVFIAHGPDALNDLALFAVGEYVQQRARMLLQC